jgi:hypothetical protein
VEKLVGVIRDGLAALAGLGLIVYLAGGAIVGVRLAAARLPMTAVVGQLPRNVLISVGLAEGLLPILIVGAGYMGLRSLIYRKGPPPADRKHELHKMWGGKAGTARAWHLGWTVAATVLVLLPAIIGGIVIDDSMLHENSAFFGWAIAVSAFVTWLVMLLYLNMRARIFHQYGNDMTAVRPTLLHSFLVVVALVPASVAFWSVRPLEHATACLTRVPNTATTPATVSGYLVGETSDHVYVGEIGRRHPSLISLPSTQIRQVVAGDNANAKSCVATHLG